MVPSPKPYSRILKVYQQANVAQLQIYSTEFACETGIDGSFCRDWFTSSPTSNALSF